MAGGSGETPSLVVARRFLEQRRSGKRVSIDAVLDAIPDVADRTMTRAGALRTITLEVQATRGITQTPGGTFDPGHDLYELPKLDGYDLIDLIGQGGMGRVYEGYQQSTGRRVAVKFLLEYSSATESARHRFEREVELVVRLQHPNIVSVLDSGIHKGRYYYVMEYVDGSRLDEALPPGECDVRDAMRTMQLICRTVDYAHQRGVLHRDLKPSNIMVDQRGEPHILDFGLAKSLDSHGGIEMTLSQPGQLLGTLGYMSPEQSQGRMQLMSVRSDVYSLGAITYELLTGELPCDTTGPLNISLTNIVEQEPRKPSAIRGKLDADANAIVLKALEKVPENRYATAGEFAADMERYLANESITARRPSLTARTVRWVKRNRAVATVGCTAMLVILGITTLSFVRIIRERDRAEERFHLLKETFLSTNPDRVTELDAVMAPIIDHFAVQLETVLASQPDAQAELRNIIGQMYVRRHEGKKARQLFDRSLAQRIDLFGGQHPKVAECYHHLGSAFYELQEFDESLEKYKRALEMRTGLLGDKDPSVYETKFYMAAAYWKLGERDKADENYREGLEFRKRHFGQDSREVASAENNLARFLLGGTSQEGYAEAQDYFEKALEKLRGLPPEQQEPSREALTLQNLGKCFMKQKEYEESEVRFWEVLRLKDQIHGRETETAATTLQDLAELELTRPQGDLERARDYCQEALQIRLSKLDPDHKDVKASEKMLEEINAAIREKSSTASE